MIPTAGRATRLGLARHRPKAFLQIGNRPLIDHLLERLPRVVTDVCLVVPPDGGGAPELGPVRLDRRIHHVVQPRPLGVADAVMRAGAVVSGPILVVMGDVFYEDPLGPYVEALREADASGGILVESATGDSEDPVGLVKLEGDRVIETWKAVPTERIRFRICGLFLLPEAALQVGPGVGSEAGDEFEMEDLVQDLISRGFVFRAVEYRGWRRNVNTATDLRIVRRRVGERGGIDRGASGLDATSATGTEDGHDDP